MPVPLRTNHLRTEAKYNVTTEFPSLGLHSAACSGNVGLVDYALSRGQPVNSVIDGILPLHAACAGGNVHVVKLLIDYGADVNAPRLPKCISSRDSSVPIIGTTGSTPLHFAAANGNREAIMLLLLHGAHADRPDKHGVTPEALARQHGWIECADDLKQWIINKDRDLREREEFVTADDRSHGRLRNRIGSFGDQEPTRRRLHVKQSIDTALNILRSSSSNSTEACHRGVHSSTLSGLPTRPFGDYSSTLGNVDNAQISDLSARRPSLPHIMQSDSFPPPRKPFADNQRPRSAGEGPEETTSVPSIKTSRRLPSKVSLLNLFRKGQSEDNNSNTSLPISDVPSLSTSPALTSGSSFTQHQQRSHHGSDASIRSRKMTDIFLNSPIPMATDLHNIEQGPTNRDRSKSNDNVQCDHIADDPVLTRTNSYHSPSSSPLARISLLRSHHGHHHTRSGSGSSLGHEANMPSRLGIASTTILHDDSTNSKPGGVGVDTDNLSRSLSRSGILRIHSRNGSNGQGHLVPSALRTLSSQRYDVPSHPPSPRGTSVRLKSSNSYGSLARTDSYSRRQRSMRRGSAESMSGLKKGDDDGDAPIEEEQEDEDEYGKPIETEETSLLIGATKAPSSSSSLSPIISDDQAIGEGEGALTTDFPFSINRPPRISREGDINDVNPSTIPMSTGVSAKVSDSRYRGDSLSSVKITDNQDYLKGNHTASKMTDVAPLKSPEVPPSSAEVVDAGNEIRRSQYLINYPTTNVPGSFSSLLSPQSQPPQQSPPLDLDSRMTHTSSHTLVNLTPSSTLVSKDLSGCKALGIDISSISTHAQAEALVEHLSQQVMEFASLDEQELEFEPGRDGRTPLSARLAAYGESLALARRLKELEDGSGSMASGVTARSVLMNEESIGANASAMKLMPVANNLSHSSEHSGSLYGKRSVGALKGMPSPRSVGTGLNGVVGRQKRSPRPPSVEGLAPRDQNLSLSSELSFQSMQSIVSASPLGCQADKTPPRQQPIPTLSISDAEDDTVHQQPVLIQSFITRSHTPVNEREAEHKTGISRMTSLDAMAYVDDKFGEALCRVSTAPSQAPRLPPGRSAKKLSKMGISVVDQAGINMAAPHVAAPSAKRFKLKSLFKVGKP